MWYDIIVIEIRKYIRASKKIRKVAFIKSSSKNMKKAKVGLLPLYIALYDEFLGYMRPTVEEYYKTITRKLENEGLEVISAPICRIEKEFDSAVKSFEDNGADAIVTLHIAYSPALHAERALSKTKLPIIILDTTLDYDFDNLSEIDYNHGIHGVQDMCNILKRHNVGYQIFTGHFENSPVCKKVADCARAIIAAESLSDSRVGLIGDIFDGMGDFRVPFEALEKELGVKVIKADPKEINKLCDAVSDEELSALKAEDEKRFTNIDVSDELYNDVTRTSLGVKAWYEKEKLDAFTMNFLSTGSGGVRCMVFDRASRAMEDGIGYAGEGDVLTAAFVGALLKAWENTSFVEMFCPNWKRGYLFLSHMGELNLRVTEGKPIMFKRPFMFTDAGDPYAIMAPMKAGRAVLLNLAPFGNGKYLLTAVNGEILSLDNKDKFERVVTGWFKPDMPLDEMLKKYSEGGATHHSAVVYDAEPEAFKAMADRFGWDFAIH